MLCLCLPFGSCIGAWVLFSRLPWSWTVNDGTVPRACSSYWDSVVFLKNKCFLSYSKLLISRVWKRQFFCQIFHCFYRGKNFQRSYATSFVDKSIPCCLWLHPGFSQSNKKKPSIVKIISSFNWTSFARCEIEIEIWFITDLLFILPFEFVFVFAIKSDNILKSVNLRLSPIKRLQLCCYSVVLLRHSV